MYQSGHLESDLWEDGFIDPHIWLVDLGPPDITSGSYNPSLLSITASGESFYLFQGSGELFYRKDSGPWIAMPLYISWNNVEIVGKVVAPLDFGTYDLKIVRHDSEEDTLLNAFDVAPPTWSEYYADVNTIVSGTGIESSPWTLSQLKAYFRDDVGYFPLDGDIVNVRGDINVNVVDSYVFLVAPGENVTITVRAWGKKANGLYTVSMPNSGQEIFRIDTGSSDVTLDIRDMAVLVQDVSGPDLTHLTLVNSLDNTAGINNLILRGSMIISENDVRAVRDDGMNTTSISIYGSNISIKDASLYFNVGDTLLFDSAINLQGTAGIVPSAFMLIWDHCEFNTVSAPIPGTLVDCTFESPKLDLLPTFLTYSDFYENDFNYRIYDLDNEGNGTAFWDANGMATDIRGSARTGIGAFRFEAYDYYVDGSKTTIGDGTEADQFTFNQFRNYFSSSLGEPCGLTPTGHDTFLMTNIFTPIDNFFIRITDEIGGYVIVKSADIGRDKAWFIETKESS